MARKSSPPERRISTTGLLPGPLDALSFGLEFPAVFVACLLLPLLSLHWVTGFDPVMVPASFASNHTTGLMSGMGEAASRSGRTRKTAQTALRLRMMFVMIFSFMTLMPTVRRRSGSFSFQRQIFGRGATYNRTAREGTRKTPTNGCLFWRFRLFFQRLAIELSRLCISQIFKNITSKRQLFFNNLLNMLVIRHIGGFNFLMKSSEKTCRPHLIGRTKTCGFSNPRQENGIRTLQFGPSLNGA